MVQESETRYVLEKYRGVGGEEPHEHAKWMTSPLCSACGLCNFPDCGDPSRLLLTYLLVTHTESSHRPAPRIAQEQLLAQEQL